MAAILDSIKKAFKMMPEIVGSLGAFVLSIVIFVLLMGVFVYQSVTSGNINVDASSSSLISAQVTNFSAVLGTMWSAVTSVTGFIVIGVIALVAIGILGRKMLGGGRL